jgi:16S rRNA (guanine(966)-N(2))-methyltransferase RsmD
MRKKMRTVTVGSGDWRGRALQYPDDSSLRPTMQRTKHSLFSSLGSKLRGAVFVDCFAGAGGVGIEALSLGAGHVHFIEERRDAVDALRANLALCGAAPARYDVYHARVADVLVRDPNPLADASIIFADPPYDADLVEEFFLALDPRRFPELRTVVVEHRTKNRIVPQLSLRLDRERRFGETTITYLAPTQEG